MWSSTQTKATSQPRRSAGGCDRHGCDVRCLNPSELLSIDVQHAPAFVLVAPGRILGLETRQSFPRPRRESTRETVERGLPSSAAISNAVWRRRRSTPIRSRPGAQVLRDAPRPRGAVAQTALARFLEALQPLMPGATADARGFRCSLHRPAFLANPIDQKTPGGRRQTRVSMQSHSGISSEGFGVVEQPHCPRRNPE